MYESGTPLVLPFVVHVSLWTGEIFLGSLTHWAEINEVLERTNKNCACTIISLITSFTPVVALFHTGLAVTCNLDPPNCFLQRVAGRWKLEGE